MAEFSENRVLSRDWDFWDSKTPKAITARSVAGNFAVFSKCRIQQIQNE